MKRNQKAKENRSNGSLKEKKLRVYQGRGGARGRARVEDPYHETMHQKSRPKLLKKKQRRREREGG